VAGDDTPTGAAKAATSPPLPRRTGPAEWLRRFLRRLLDREFTALEQRVAQGEAALAATSGRLDEIAARTGMVEGRLDEVRQRLEPIATGSLQRHLETRIDQALAEVADLRGAYLATRGEFEAVRDDRLPRAEATVAGVQEGVTALQREVERVRDAALPEVAATAERLHGAIVVVQGELSSLRDGRLARTEGDVARIQAAVEKLQTGVEELAQVRVAQSEAAVARLHEAVEVVQRELRETNDVRLTRNEADLARIQAAVEALQKWLESLGSERLARMERDLGGLHAALVGLQRLAEELRDARLPALADRTDALVERLHLELTELGGLVDRLVAREPIHVAAEPAVEAALPAAVASAASAFVDSLRGEREEILQRAEAYVPLLSGCEPVLDLGCGRGELLEALQRAGIAARGIDGDPAMVAACRRRGLAAEVGELPEALLAMGEGSVGAVCAIHVLEHLPAAGWMAVVDAARRVLRPGGLLVVECPNPDTLRVGAGLFWSDPTHRTPIHPRALELVVRAVGFEIEEVRFLRPFPAEQRLTSAAQPDELRRVAERLDEWLSGPRDFVLVARKP